MDDVAGAERDPRVGSVLAKQYRLEALIGEGGMGAVYRAQQLSVNRQVAVKLIAGKVAENPECVKRFRREAEATARLGHPNTVRLFDFGVSEQGELFMVMELLEGVDLARHLTLRGRLPVDEALRIMRQVLEALSEAHTLGIVHRDLKPANIFLAEVRGGSTLPKVTDFGIAGIEEAAGETKLTLTGSVIGTPAYMSPEQAQGQVVDARSDLYSLGVVLFEVLTGKPPFEADSAVSLLLAQVSTPPPKLVEAAPELRAGAALQAFLDALLEKNPDRRPPSARAAIRLLDALPPADAAAETSSWSGRGAAPSALLAAAQSTLASALKARPRRVPAALGALAIPFGVWLLWPEPQASPRPIHARTSAPIAPSTQDKPPPARAAETSPHVAPPPSHPPPKPAATSSQPGPSTRHSGARTLSPRERREALLRRGPAYRNVAAAKRAYRSGRLTEEAYEDTIWVLKTQRSTRILAEKLNYKRGLISRDEYARRVDRIDAEYKGR